MDYSTKRISSQLIEEITSALQSVNFGSIEIYVSNSNVTQITTRTIKKTPSSSEKKTKKKNQQPNGHGKTKKYLVSNLVNFNSEQS